jgi:hypothetical protein
VTWFLSLPRTRTIRPTIDELEALLNSDDDVEIEIMPNGEIRERLADGTSHVTGRKPLTMRDNLGGEYAFA